MPSILIADTKQKIIQDVSDAALNAVIYDCKIITSTSGNDCMNIVRNSEDWRPDTLSG
jgi:hypothetical protein